MPAYLRDSSNNRGSFPVPEYRRKHAKTSHYTSVPEAGPSSRNASKMCFFRYSLLAILACCCWGLENNCTRMLSQSAPSKIPSALFVISFMIMAAGAYLAAEKERKRHEKEHREKRLQIRQVCPAGHLPEMTSQAYP